MALVRRGDIYLINYCPNGREGKAAHIHPGVVVTNNTANGATYLLMTVPITSNVKRLFVTDVFLPNHRTGLDQDSKAQVEAMRATHVSRFMKKLGFVPDDLMETLDDVIRMHLSL